MDRKRDKMETIERPEVGCLIDGHKGIYGPVEMIRIAQSYGLYLDDQDETAVMAYELDYEEFEYEGEAYCASCWLLDQGGLCDYVEEWLNEFIAEEGYYFGWNDGEFFYQSEDWWAENGHICEECNEDDEVVFDCLDCNVSTLEIEEYYMVKDAVWLEATGLDNDTFDGKVAGMLCIGCLETRIGRRLVPGDFTDCPLNNEGTYRKSDRLNDRLGN